MTPAIATAISVVQPEGWVRLRIHDGVDRQIAELSGAIARTADPAHRDLVRTRVRRAFRELADTAASHAYEVWIPVASTGGVAIPLTVTVGPLPTQPPAQRSRSDSLLAIAAGSAGSRAVSVGGRLAVRTVADIPGVKDHDGRYSSFPRRRVIVTVAPDDSPEAEWLAFVGEVLVPEVDDAADIVAASEFFFDALLATVSFGDPRTNGGRSCRLGGGVVSFYIHYPDDWIGVPPFGDGEVFATPEAWAAALVEEIAPDLRPKPRRRQRGNLAGVLALLGGSVREIGADAGYIWLDTLESAPFLVGSKVIARSEAGDASLPEIAGAGGDGDYVPPIVRELTTASGLNGVYVERHAPLDEAAVHVGMLVGTYVFEAENEVLMLGTSTTDFAGYERFRSHFEQFARTARWE